MICLILHKIGGWSYRKDSDLALEANASVVQNENLWFMTQWHLMQAGMLLT
jgi:hypothetical protein